MSVPTTAPPKPAKATPASNRDAPPPPSTSSSSPARATSTKPKQPAAASRKRKPVRRRGARPDDDDESELAPPPTAPRTATTTTTTATAAAAGSDSDSDFVPSPQDDDSDDDDSDGDDDEHEGATEPRTPASASVEQLGGSGVAKPSKPPHKAVLAGPDVPPSWSDAVDAAQDGDDSVALPTLDFADLTLDTVQALPSVAVSSGAPAAQGVKPPSKKQLVLQRREAKSAALKARDPAEWERQEKERAERDEAKRVAKKDKLKEKRRERKMAERAAKEDGEGPVEETASPTAAGSASAPARAPAPTTRPARPPRPVVPSRPSRTGLALGLVPSTPASPTTTASPSTSSRPAPAPADSTASTTSPVVPSSTRQPAFLPRDAQGKPSPQPFGSSAVRGRGRGRGGLAAGPSTRRGPAHDEGGADVAPAGSASTPGEWSHSGFDELEAERGTAHSPSTRGSGCGGLRGERGGAAGAGRGGSSNASLLASGVNPRFAHLPFHPSHRFHPGAQPKPVAPEPVAPEATTAAPADELFREDEGAAASKGKEDVVGVRLPDAQVSLAIKGGAARAAAKETEKEKENAPPAQQVVPPAAADAADELRKEPSVLYAADPARFAVPPGSAAQDTSSFAPFEQQQLEASLPPFPQQVPAPASFYQVPPHLQQAATATAQAPYIPRHSSPAYFAPPPHATFFPDPMTMAPSPSATSTPPPPFGAIHTPTSAYFLPPRLNKRVEIKAPSRDGQSPVPLRTAVVQAAPDALEAAQQARISQLVREAEERQHGYANRWAQYSDGDASSAGAQAASSSPASTRAAFLPPSSPVMPQQQQHLQQHQQQQQQQQHPGFAPSPFYGSAPLVHQHFQQQHFSAPGPGQLPPSSAPMYNTFTHSSHDSFDGAMPGSEHFAAAQFASPPPPTSSHAQQPQQYPLGVQHQHQHQQEQPYYSSHPISSQVQHPHQVPHFGPGGGLPPMHGFHDPYAAAMAQAQAQAQFYAAQQPGAEQGRWY
ncbi:hypothetical protein JCM3775_001315 [Rhodotorula graminis]